ncbi:hypothetical protein MKK58_07640 [Methylobacterium sp. J-078]|uniref:hypothetical protein n=1 Tax=Methylobacterium sp. J-078 TaxID=2836657 RepID=UPI001FBA175D|nr:hypothetical protein [Methylobacterium sp. J-078]MCJ2044405.1 hypothetical protein [Methylobacterium sp. J-078]
MSISALSRPAQRRLKRLTAENEASILSDARFFERRPDRSHRIRLSSLAEVETIRLLHPGNQLTPGLRWYTAVRQVRQGVRLRVFSMGLPDLDTDEPEDVCRWVYERGRTGGDDAIERGLRRAMEARS